MFYSKKTNSVKRKPNLKAKLDKEFSLFIRLRDTMPSKYFKCISCGRILPFAQADCGHYINRRIMNTRYDEVNCNAQCRHCNRFMEGNIQDYRKGLVEKYGEKRVLLLEAAKKNIHYTFSEFEYKYLINYYKAEIKKLKEQKCF